MNFTHGGIFGLGYDKESVSTAYNKQAPYWLAQYCHLYCFPNTHDNMKPVWEFHHMHMFIISATSA